MGDDTANLILAVATENAELRAQLAEAQELMIETAVDAGEMHARVEELQAELAALRAEHDAYRRCEVCAAIGRSYSVGHRTISRLEAEA